MISKRILFLDIDGVLVSYKKLKDRHPEDNENYFEQEAVEALNALIDKYDLKVVISSSWRNCRGHMDDLQNIFNLRGVKCELIDDTGWFLSPPNARGREIKNWIDKNGEPEFYIILDDEVEGIKPILNNWYRTDRDICLTKEDLSVIDMMVENVWYPHIKN